MRKVLHLWQYYGQRSQIWLYRQLVAGIKYQPHLLLRKSWLEGAHPDEFPFPPEQLHYFPQKNIIQRVLARAVTVLQTGRRDTFSSADIYYIIKSAAEIDSDILHIHFGWTAVKLLPFFKMLQNAGIKIVVSFYGSDVFRLSPEYQKYLIKLLKSPVKIIVTSSALKAELVNLGGNEADINIIPVGINIRELLSDKNIPAAENNGEVKIFSVGRLVNFKAPEELPQIARILKDNDIDFEWIVAGDGPLLSVCIENSRKYDVQDRILFVGAVPFYEVKKYMQKSDIFVHNAVIADDGSREALGVTLMEAGGFGLPVVSCNVGGIPEVVIDSETGILTEEKQPEKMAAAIMRLADDKALREEMGGNAAWYIRERFDSEKLVEQVEAVYMGM